MKVSERWEKRIPAYALDIGQHLRVLVEKCTDGRFVWEATWWGPDRYYVSAEGFCNTLESAQIAAEAWLRERAREILAVVGEEQR